MWPPRKPVTATRSTTSMRPPSRTTRLASASVAARSASRMPRERAARVVHDHHVDARRTPRRTRPVRRRGRRSSAPTLAPTDRARARPPSSSNATTALAPLSPTLAASPPSSDAIVAPDLEEALAHSHAGHRDVQRVHLAVLAHGAEELAEHGLMIRSPDCEDANKHRPPRASSECCSSASALSAPRRSRASPPSARASPQPIGSLTQMGTIRLGKRSDGRSPKIKEFVDLASLDDIVFGGWDIFEEDCYAAARTAGVLEPSLLDQVRPRDGSDQADAGRLRPALRQASQRAERQEGQEQEGSRRAADRRHPRASRRRTAARGW